MSVLMIMEAPGATTSEYDRANEIMGIHGDDDAPDGLVQHVAASNGDGIVIVDLWESEEALGRFFEERLGAALEQAGLGGSAKPRILPVHNSVTGQGKEAGILMLIEIDDLDTDGYDAMASNMDAHTGDASHGPWVSHTAASKEGGGILVADLWESAEAFGKFAEEQIGPAAAEQGLGPIEPRLIPVHNRIKGKAAEAPA